MPKLSKEDRKFLRAVGVKPERFPQTRAERGGRKDTEDGVIKLMREAGVEITRENYLIVAFMGNPPAEIDGEILAEIPEYLREPDDE